MKIFRLSLLAVSVTFFACLDKTAARSIQLARAAIASADKAGAGTYARKEMAMADALLDEAIKSDMRKDYSDAQMKAELAEEMAEKAVRK